MTGLVQGDARAIPLATGSVQCVVTSPPYWGLRDYGTARWVGGDPNCDHGVRRWEGPKQTQGAQSGHASKADVLNRTECACGARRIDAQLGLESTPDEYVASMVAVFREVWRVLRDDGTLWLNLGDSYFSQGGSRTSCTNTLTGQGNRREAELDESRTVPAGFKPKDLIGIPWRVAFALQADGWYLRNDLIWSKPNPMPESVRDRCTRSHEYIFLLTKQPRYYYDAAAIAEPGVFPAGTRAAKGSVERSSAPGVNSRPPEYKIYSGTRNRRSVWTVTTQPYPEAHFATFPEKLVEPCILAGTKPGDLVLDPFAGSGTVGLVAARHGRHYVGMDLNPVYLALAHARIHAPVRVRRPVRKRAPAAEQPSLF